MLLRHSIRVPQVRKSGPGRAPSIAGRPASLGSWASRQSWAGNGSAFTRRSDDLDTRQAYGNIPSGAEAQDSKHSCGTTKVVLFHKTIYAAH